MVVPQDDKQILQSAISSAKDHNIEIEQLSCIDLQERYPQFEYECVGNNAIGILEPGGGFLRPEAAIRAALYDAEQHGATILEETVVKSIKEIFNNDDTGKKVSHVEITIVSKQSGEEEIIKARNVLVAAGAWTSEVIPSYAKHLKVTRQLQAWVKMTASSTDPCIYNFSKMPATAIKLNNLPNPFVYTLPADIDSKNNKDNDQASLSEAQEGADDEYKDCVKIGIHCRDCPINPNINYSTSVTSEEEEEIRNAIHACFCQDVSSQPIQEVRPCMYTMTEDEHFLIGPPEGYENVSVVAGLSGHGFKMCPALGQMLADFASGKGLDSWDADFCSPNRFDA